MKKRFILVTALLIVMSIISGCGVNYASKKDIEDMNAFELIHEMTQGDPYQPIEVDYENMGRDEYIIRSVVEASAIFRDNHKNGFNEEEDLKKYGISRFRRLDNLVLFDNLEDMKTVISNKQFQDDYFLLFGIHFKPDAYYLPVSLGIESDDIDIYAMDDRYYFSIIGSEIKGGFDYLVIWGVFDTSQDIDARETAQLYADLCDAELKTQRMPDGNTVYYYSGMRSILIEDMGLCTKDIATAYLWEQDGVLGVIVWNGEHNEDMFDFCVLERNELGYIYVENGKTVMKPLAYPGEKYGDYKENEFGVPVLQDITEQMYKSIELPKELVDKIKSMLAEQGLTIDFP